MVRVTVELFSARTGRRTVLCTAEITNNGEETRENNARGSYVVKLRDKAGRIWREGRVSGFPRKRLLAWDLLYRALASCGLAERQ